MKKILAIAGIIAILAVLAVPMTALAATGQSGNTEISGSISSVLEITAPNPIVLGTMGVGDNSGNSTNGNVNCNNAIGYILTVEDAMLPVSPVKNSSITGFMWTGDTTTTLVLGSPLQVKSTSGGTYTDATTQRTWKTTSGPSI